MLTDNFLTKDNFHSYVLFFNYFKSFLWISIDIDAPKTDELSQMLPSTKKLFANEFAIECFISAVSAYLHLVLVPRMRYHWPYYQWHHRME